MQQPIQQHYTPSTQASDSRLNEVLPHMMHCKDEESKEKSQSFEFGNCCRLIPQHDSSAGAEETKHGMILPLQPSECKLLKGSSVHEERKIKLEVSQVDAASHEQTTQDTSGPINSEDIQRKKPQRPNKKRRAKYK